MKGIIEYTVFGRIDAEYHPECNNEKYLDYVDLSTGLSRGIVGYGYKYSIPSDNQIPHKTFHYRWLKKSLALKYKGEVK